MQIKAIKQPVPLNNTVISNRLQFLFQGLISSYIFWRINLQSLFLL